MQSIKLPQSYFGAIRPKSARQQQRCRCMSTPSDLSPAQISVSGSFCKESTPSDLNTAQISVSGSFYEEVVEELSQRALALSSRRPRGAQPFIIGIAGAPGSGKSTLASLTTARINELASEGGLALNLAVTVPMDGFHLYRSQLDAMSDPKEAHLRRGAHWTFDSLAFVQCVQSIQHIGECSVAVPSFDHGVGDPCDGEIRVDPTHRIILVEGNYVLLDEAPWSELLGIFDDTWFVDVDLDVAMKRVYERQTGNGKDPETVQFRIGYNDRPNGELVNTCKSRAKVLVPSSIPFKV